MKKRVAFFILIFLAFQSFAADLKILPEDLMVIPEYQGKFLAKEDLQDKRGFHLYIRKKKGMESVMLTETTVDPSGKSNNYSLRAKEFNSINGNEIRYLNGKILDSPSARFSLISSTVEKNKYLGECFHIYVPETVVFGYSWTRNGEIKIENGTFINIRAFSKKYGEYEGGEYKDNPFKVNLRQPKKKPEVKPKEIVKKKPKFVNEAEEAFNEIAEISDGEILYSFGKKNLSDDLLKLVEKVKDEPKVEIVFAIDATGSMKDDFEELLQNWIPKLKKQVATFKDISIGLLLYKDYGEDYNDKNLPVKIFGFADMPPEPVEQFAKWLRYADVKAGGDRPEAVYEAIYASIRYFDWSDDAKKKIVLIGDAEPHPSPRGSKDITFSSVTNLAKQKNITLDCLIILDEKYKKTVKDRQSEEMKNIKKTEQSNELVKSLGEMKNEK